MSAPRSRPPSPPAPEPAAPAPGRLPLAHAALIFAVAILVRLWHVFQLRGTPYAEMLLGDARGYDAWARRIAGGDWVGTEVFYQAPLYPYVLGALYAVLGPSPDLVRVVQSALGAASAVLVGVAAARFVSARTGLTAGLVLALYAPAIFFDGLLQKSSLDVFFVSASLALLARLSADATSGRTLWLALGATAGALALTRENALVVVPILAAWAWWGAPLAPARRVHALGAFAAGVALLLVPVAARNYAVSGGVYLTTAQFGPNFYIGNHAGADGSYQALRFGRGSPEYERVDATELAERASGRTLTPGEVSAYWRDRAFADITAAPGRWLALLVRKAALLVNADEAIDTESQESYAEWSWPLRLLGPVTHFGVLVPLAVLGVWVTWGARRRLWVLYAMTGAVAVTTIAFYVFARYRYPLAPVLILFASAALTAGRDWLTKAPRGRAALAVGTAVSLAVVCQWPLLSASRSRAITATNLGTAFYERGQHAAAVTHFQRALEVQPDYVPAFNNLGVALRAAGRTDDAIRAYRQGLSLRDDYPDLHYNLANALLAVNRPDEAAEHLRKAASGEPDSAGTHNNLGLALAEKGQLAEAAIEFAAAVALDPASAKAHRNLGNVLGGLGRHDEAERHLRQATTLDPADADAHYDLGVFLLGRDRNREAAEALGAAIRVRPGYVEAHNNLGIALGSLGDLDRAMAQFEEALRLQPGFADAARNLQTARDARRAMGTQKR